MTLVTNLQVLAVREIAEDVSERLRVVNDGFEIDISDGPWRRRRFTLAHEFGHTFFYGAFGGKPQRLTVSPDPEEEERFCDSFAAELLMPRKSVVESLEIRLAESTIGRAEILVRLADQFEVSIHAMARRLIQDLQIWDAVAFGARWITSAPSDKENPSDYSWRRAWHTRSGKIPNTLFIPPAYRRPEIRASIIESVFLQKRPAIALHQFTPNLGNLRDVLAESYGDFVDVTLFPIIPDLRLTQEAAHLPFYSPDSPDGRVRSASEVVAVFAHQVPRLQQLTFES